MRNYIWMYLMFVVVLFACTNNPLEQEATNTSFNIPIVEPQPVSLGLEINPPAFIAQTVGYQQNFSVKLIRSDGKHQDVTDQATFKSANQSIVKFNGYTGLAEGSGTTTYGVSVIDEDGKTVSRMSNAFVAMQPEEMSMAYLRVLTTGAASAFIFLKSDSTAFNNGFFARSPSRILPVEPDVEFTVIATERGFEGASKTVTVSVNDTVTVTLDLVEIPPPTNPMFVCDSDVVRASIRIDGRQTDDLRIVNIQGPLQSLIVGVGYSNSQQGQSQEIFRARLENLETNQVFFSKFVPDNQGGVKPVKLEFESEIPRGVYQVSVEHAALTDPMNITVAPSSIQFYWLVICYLEQN